MAGIHHAGLSHYIPGFEALLWLEIDCDFGFMFIENQSGFVYMGTTSPSLCKLVQTVMKEKSGHCG